MSTIELISKIEALREWEDLQAQAAEMAESLRDEIKHHMDATGQEEVTAGQYIVRWTTVQSSRFDTKRFKQELGEDLYKKYTKEVTSRRFTVSA